PKAEGLNRKEWATRPSEPCEARSGGKTRRLGVEQLPGVCLPASSAGASKLSGMAADDQLFPFSGPLIRTSRMRWGTRLAIAACRQRRRVRFTTAAALVNQLVEAQRE